MPPSKTNGSRVIRFGIIRTNARKQFNSKTSYFDYGKLTWLPNDTKALALYPKPSLLARQS